MHFRGFGQFGAAGTQPLCGQRSSECNPYHPTLYLLRCSVLLLQCIRCFLQFFLFLLCDFSQFLDQFGFAVIQGLVELLERGSDHILMTDHLFVDALQIHTECAAIRIWKIYKTLNSSPSPPPKPCSPGWPPPFWSFESEPISPLSRSPPVHPTNLHKKAIIHTSSHSTGGKTAASSLCKPAMAALSLIFWTVDIPHSAHKLLMSFGSICFRMSLSSNHQYIDADLHHGHTWNPSRCSPIS